MRVRPQSLKLLALLLTRPGDVVSRDDIQQALWGRDTFVDFEQGVNHAIRELRAVLGDSAESPRFIRTFARRGYGFIAPIERLPPEVAARRRRRPAGCLRTTRTSGRPAAARDRRGAGGVRRGGCDSRRTRAVVARRGAATASTIEVVPFAAAATDSALGAGLASAIVTRLGAQHRAFVRSAPVSGPPSGNRGRDHLRGAALVLSGEVLRQGDDIAVAARLERVATGEVVWTERFQLRATELHSLENVIAERVVTALDLNIAAAEQDRLRRRYTRTSPRIRTICRGGRCWCATRLTRRSAPSPRSNRRFDAIPGTRSHGRAWRWRAPTCASGSHGRQTSSGGEQRAEAEARAALELDRQHRRGTPRARRGSAQARVRLEPGCRLEPACAGAQSQPRPGALLHRRRVWPPWLHGGGKDGSRERAAPAGVDALEAIRQQGILALWSGNFAPSRVHLEEVSRLSDQAIADTYLALAYYYSGSVEQSRALLESLSRSSSASTAARAGAALASILARAHPSDARAHIESVSSASIATITLPTASGRRTCSSAMRQKPRAG